MNDFNVEELDYEIFYRDAFDRIPYIFRFEKKRIKAMTIALGILGAAIIIMLMILPSTQKINEGWLPVSSTGGTLNYATYSLPLFIAIVICIICAVVLLLWIALSIEFEKQAHKRATTKHREYRDEYMRRLKLQNDEIKKKYEHYQ